MFIRITWEATVDERVCPICKALNGFTWTFNVGADQMGDSLVHPEFGVVWNLSQGSRAHGHTGINCRCRISNEVNMQTLNWKLEELVKKFEAKVQAFEQQ